KYGYRFVGPVTISRPANPVSTAPPTRWPGKFWAAGGAVFLLALIAAAWEVWIFTGAAHTSLERLTTESGLTQDPALSPVDNRIVYASDRVSDGGLHLWIRHLGGGEPLPLTRHPADDSDPAFSPDGRSVAFHSERDGGGLYLIATQDLTATQGGEERRIADLGRGPQFSPDGRWIAYWVGDIPSGVARVYVVEAGGGTPRRIDGACGYAAGSPVWSSDGRYILFWCKSYSQGSPVRDSDWWVAPAEGGPEIKTYAAQSLQGQGLSPDNEVFTPSAWIGNQIVFAAKRAGKTNMWRVSLAPDRWRVNGRPEQLTFADLPVRKASLAKGPRGESRMAFAAISEGSDIWGLPVDANHRAVAGAIQRLTNDPGGVDRPSVSADGRTMAYTSYRSGSQSLWAKDLRSRVEWLLSDNTAVVQGPHVSPDGSRVAYARLEGQKRSVYTASLEFNSQYAPPLKICENCGWLWGWTPDSRSLIFDPKYDNWDGKYSIGLLDLTSSKLRVGAMDMEMIQPVISRDGAWIAFCVANRPGTRQVVISRFRDSAASGPRIAPSVDWVAVTPGDAVDTSPVWSPDGNLLYYVSPRDGGRCIWAQRLDAGTKRPLGPPWAVHHMHRPSLGVKQLGLEMRIGLSLAGDQLIFAQAERSGSIWMTTSSR
ncbi:MAG TPA: hypothetical protein VFC21_05410, partial [Bryobacteraceae bacterium]|nr:hypothetical protein [Bryobacteraceae bacterium]